jgi:hypothetical protein
VVNILGSDPDDVAVGLPVHVVWDDVAEGVSIPRMAIGTPPGG